VGRADRHGEEDQGGRHHALLPDLEGVVDDAAGVERAGPGHDAVGLLEEAAPGDVSFQQAYPAVMQKMLQLKKYGPPDPFGFDYNTGNREMADGKAAMLLQGIWAVPNIRAINPKVNLGAFPLPATNDPAKNKLVSGVDILLTLPKQKTKHQAEALEFIRWLMRKQPAAEYAKEQNAFSAVKGVKQNDPSLVALNPVFESNHIVGFADHHIPSSIPLDSLIQGAMIDGNIKGFLSNLDDQYRQALARRGIT